MSLEIREEKMRIDGMQTALDSYRNLLRDYSQIENLIKKKTERSTNDENLSARYNKEIKDLEEKTNELAENLQVVENNIRNEFAWFSKERESHLESALTSIIVSQRKRYKQESEFWLEKKHQVIR